MLDVISGCHPSTQVECAFWADSCGWGDVSQRPHWQKKIWSVKSYNSLRSKVYLLRHQMQIFIRLIHTVFNHGLSMEEFLKNTKSRDGWYLLAILQMETNAKMLQDFRQVTVDLRDFLIPAVSHLLSDSSSWGRWTCSWWTSPHGGGSKGWWWHWTLLYFLTSKEYRANYSTWQGLPWYQHLIITASFDIVCTSNNDFGCGLSILPMGTLARTCVLSPGESCKETFHSARFYHRQCQKGSRRNIRKLQW